MHYGIIALSHINYALSQVIITDICTVKRPHNVNHAI